MSMYDGRAALATPTADQSLQEFSRLNEGCKWLCLGLCATICTSRLAFHYAGMEGACDGNRSGSSLARPSRPWNLSLDPGPPRVGERNAITEFQAPSRLNFRLVEFAAPPRWWSQVGGSKLIPGSTQPHRRPSLVQVRRNAHPSSQVRTVARLRLRSIGEAPPLLHHGLCALGRPALRPASAPPCAKKIHA